MSSANGSPERDNSDTHHYCLFVKRALKVVQKVYNDWCHESALHHLPSIKNQLKNQLFCKCRIETGSGFDTLLSREEIQEAYSAWVSCRCRGVEVISASNGEHYNLLYDELPGTTKSLMDSLDSEYRSVKALILKETSRD